MENDIRTVDFYFENQCYPVDKYSQHAHMQPVGEEGFDYVPPQYVYSKITLLVAEEPAVFRVWADDPDIRLPGRLDLCVNGHAVMRHWFEDGECTEYRRTPGIDLPGGGTGYRLELHIRVPFQRSAVTFGPNEEPPGK